MMVIAHCCDGETGHYCSYLMELHTRDLEAVSTADRVSCVGADLYDLVIVRFGFCARKRFILVSN